MRATRHVTTGAWAGRDIPLRQPETTIGREPMADIVIPVEDQRFVFAADGGLMVTNKHIVYSHLYGEGVACIAESFPHRGLAFEPARLTR